MCRRRGVSMTTSPSARAPRLVVDSSSFLFIYFLLDAGRIFRTSLLFSSAGCLSQRRIFVQLVSFQYPIFFASIHQQLLFFLFFFFSFFPVERSHWAVPARRPEDGDCSCSAVQLSAQRGHGMSVPLMKFQKKNEGEKEDSRLCAECGLLSAKMMNCCQKK